MYAFVMFGGLLAIYILCLILDAYKHSLLALYAVNKRRFLAHVYNAKYTVRCTEVKVISSDEAPEDDDFRPDFERKGIRVYNGTDEFKEINTRKPFSPSDFEAWLPDDLFCVRYKVFNNHSGTSKVHTWLESERLDKCFPGTLELERLMNKPRVEDGGGAKMKMPSGIMTAKIYYDKREESVDVTSFVHELIPPEGVEQEYHVYRLKDLFRFLFYKAYVCPEMKGGPAGGDCESNDYEWRKVLLYFMVIGPGGLAHNYYHPDYNMNDTVNLSTGECSTNAFATSIKSNFSQATSWSDITEAEAAPANSTAEEGNTA